mgnify:CR=1 FL=1
MTRKRRRLYALGAGMLALFGTGLVGLVITQMLPWTAPVAVAPSAEHS